MLILLNGSEEQDVYSVARSLQSQISDTFLVVDPFDFFNFLPEDDREENEMEAEMILSDSYDMINILSQRWNIIVPGVFDKDGLEYFETTFKEAGVVSVILDPKCDFTEKHNISVPFNESDINKTASSILEKVGKNFE